MSRSPEDVTQFHSVDRTANPAFFLQFMDASHELGTAERYRQTMMAQLAICPKHVDPAKAIQQTKLDTTMNWYKRLLLPWTRR